jgi:hypothetical protein
MRAVPAVLFALSAVVSTVSAAEIDKDHIEALVNRLQLDSYRALWKRDTEFSPKFVYPPLTWSTQKGLFPSYVHLNFHGQPIMAAGRNKYSFPDSNGFVSMYYPFNSTSI